jgi:hypothetical protein
VRRASLALVAALAAAGLFAGRASAHAGLTAPAATSYLARISQTPRGLEAKVVDGDQRLWLQVSPGVVAVVLGLRGEPYLRFSSRGVDVNTRSATYYLNRARPVIVPPGLTRSAPPDWKRITPGRSTSWHEDRLHALALAAHPSGNSFVGRWLVPLVVDGRRTAITGGLRHATRPSLLWFWPLLLVLACVPALLRLRDAGLDGVATVGLAGLALATATAARLGRELYGRPTVSTWQLVLAGGSCLVAVALLVLVLRRDWRSVAAGAIGIVAVYQGLALLGVLRNGFVLAAIPAWVERTSAGASLASGAALLVVVILTPSRARESSTDLAVSR